MKNGKRGKRPLSGNGRVPVKTPPETQAIVRIMPNGGMLRSGNPGNSGGKVGRSGPKTLKFKAEMARLADSVVTDRIREKLETATTDDPAWRWAAEKALEYTVSKAPTKQEHGGDGEQPIVFRLDLGAANLKRIDE